MMALVMLQQGMSYQRILEVYRFFLVLAQAFRARSRPLSCPNLCVKCLFVDSFSVVECLRFVVDVSTHRDQHKYKHPSLPYICRYAWSMDLRSVRTLLSFIALLYHEFDFQIMG